MRGAGIDVVAILDEIGSPGEESILELMRSTIRELTGFSEAASMKKVLT